MRMAVHKICSRFSRGGGGAVNSSGNYLNCTRSDCASSVPETSSSTSVTDTVRGSHDFDVNGYSLVKGMGVGKYVASTTFNVGGYDWAVYFYPDGKGPEDNSTYVSLFIALASEGSDVRALFELTLLDQSGNGKHKTHTHFDRTLESGPYTLKYRGSMWGYKRFFRRSALETSDYLKDDRLSIKCTVGVVGSHIETTKIYTLPSPASCIGSEFGSLLETGTASDVEFTVDGETFKAHRLVLAARSPVFKAQFLGPLKDPNTKNVQVDDIEAPIFKAMLHFIYHDSLPDIQALVDSTSTSTTAMAFQHLLVATDRYGLDRLRLLCEAKSCEEMTPDTVATTLTLAEQHQCFQLKAVCLKFLTSVPGCLRGVMQTDGFEYLKKSCPALLSELFESIVRHERISVISKPLFKIFDGKVGPSGFGSKFTAEPVTANLLPNLSLPLLQGLH